MMVYAAFLALVDITLVLDMGEGVAGAGFPVRGYVFGSFGFGRARFLPPREL